CHVRAPPAALSVRPVRPSHPPQVEGQQGGQRPAGGMRDGPDSGRARGWRCLAEGTIGRIRWFRNRPAGRRTREPRSPAMLIQRPADIPSSEITPESVYLNRRRFMGTLAAGALAGALDPELLVGAELARPRAPRRQEEKPTSFEAITTYNNFYEFGFEKEDPSRNAHTLRTRPWSVAIEGHVKKPAVYDLEDVVKPHALEDRTYRLRCVEAWSMVIPWRGFPLADLIRRVEPTSQAKYVEFVTLHDPQQMPMQRQPVLDSPYHEGLRTDGS